MSFEKYFEFREGWNRPQTDAVDLPVQAGDDFFKIMMKADDMLQRGARGVNFTFQGQRYFIDENKLHHAMQQLQRIFQLV